MLSSQAGLGPVIEAVRASGERACVEGDYVFPRPGSRSLPASAGLDQGNARVGDVDLIQVLRHGAQSAEEVEMLTAVTLLGVAAGWPAAQEQQQALARRLLWLDSYCGFHCFSCAAQVLDGARVAQLAEGVVTLLDQAELDLPMDAVGRAWLFSCSLPECQSIAARVLGPGVQEPGVRAPQHRLSRGCHTLSGDLGPRPRNAAVVLILAVTTLLFFSRATRGLLRQTLGYRRPARLVLSSQGLELSSRHELLGRVTKERRQIVPLAEIRQVLREVRYPRLGLYAGLSALTIGTLLGTRVFVDGLRVAGLSFPMIAWGAILVLGGLALDLLMTGLSDRAKGKCRLVVHTRGAGSFSLGSLNPAEVDSLLERLAVSLASH